jgi:hypothetical protein
MWDEISIHSAEHQFHLESPEASATTGIIHFPDRSMSLGKTWTGKQATPVMVRCC